MSMQKNNHNQPPPEDEGAAQVRLHMYLAISPTRHSGYLPVCVAQEPLSRPCTRIKALTTKIKITTLSTK